MPIAIRHLDGGVTVVALSGRIDVAAAREIDLPMSVVAGARRAVVIDLTSVDFLASMGIRSLVLAAKAISRKGGSCVMFGPTVDVRAQLEASAIDTVMPIFEQFDAAVSAVSHG